MNAQTTIAPVATLLDVRLDRKALADALQCFKATGAHIIEKRNTIPILSCVLIETAPDCVRVTGTDLDLMLTIELPAATMGGASLAIDFEALHKAAKAARGETVRIVDMGGERAMLEHDGGTARLVTRDAADFPKIIPGDIPTPVQFDPAELKADLDRVAPCISTEETRYYLNGVFAHVAERESEAPRLRFAATDGHRLARIDRALPDGMDEGAPDAIIPRKAIEWIRRKGLKGAGSCSLAWSASKLAFQAGRMRLVSKLVDGTFPDYSRVIPCVSAAYGGGEIMTFPADALGDAAKDVTAHVSSRTRALTLSIGEGWATAYAFCPDNGAAHTLIDGTSYQPKEAGETPEFCAGFNAKYIAELMASFKGETVTVAMQDAVCPARIESEASPEFLAVLMPLRTDSAVMSPAALRKMNRDALEIFAEDMPAKLAAVAKLEAALADPETSDNSYLAAALATARKAAGKLVTAAIDLMASRQGCERYAARLAVLRDLATMKGEADPIATRAAASLARQADAVWHVVSFDDVEPEPVDAQPIKADDEPEAPAQPEPEAVTDDSRDYVPEGEPMFASLQEFKAMAGQGSCWIIESFEPATGTWERPRERKVATVRARDIGFLSGEATMEDCQAADVRGHGGRSWVAFPKQGDWTSDGEGLIIWSGLRPETRSPNIRLRPMPVDSSDDCGNMSSDAQPGELEALRAMVTELASRVAAMEAAQAPAQAESAAPVGHDAPQGAETAPRRSAGHERAIRMAWLQRAERRGLKAANRNLVQSIDVANATIADAERRRALASELAEDWRKQALRVQEANKRAAVAEEAVETAHRRIGALENMLAKAKRRITRLAAVLTGRNAQIEALGRDLIIARNCASDLRDAGHNPKPVDASRVREMDIAA